MKLCVVGLLLAVLVTACWGTQVPVRQRGLHTRNVNDDGRALCEDGMDPPPNRVDTTQQVQDLRDAMQAHQPPVHAFLIGLLDEHMSNGADWHKGVEFISGYTGSAGYVIITATEQALWTDGRYFLQADQEMDCNWSLMRQGEAGVLEGPEWLASLLTNGDNMAITYTLTSLSTYQSYEAAFEGTGITIIEDDDDLLGSIWTDRPDRPNNAIYEHTLEYAGVDWQTKIGNIRQAMTDENQDIDALILTGLDDIVWTFNLRGSNRPTSPLFDSYAIITHDYIELYIMNDRDGDPGLAEHLNYNPATGDCTDNQQMCVLLKLYDDISLAVEDLSNTVDLIWLSPESSNYMIYHRATAGGTTPEKAYQLRSPVQMMKAVKNEVELEKYRECQIKDSKYVIEFAAFIDEEVKQGNIWTELSAATYLNSLREADEEFRMLSFDPISASGPNGAVIHYRPTEATDRPLATDEMYLLDSGGNYLCGTTDITRTFHYGNPTDEEMEAYTRVMLGAIDLAVTVWPKGMYGSDLDVRTRAYLWQHGWDYKHGTGHGIGMFINVHEGPGDIEVGFKDIYEPLHAGMIFSDEPGFYLDGKFGVRLETDVEVVDAEIDEDQVFDNMEFLKFQMMTLVPFEKNLVKAELLDVSHRRWLNAYHDRCVEVMRPLIVNNTQAVEWFDERVVHYSTDFVPIDSSATTITTTVAVVLGAILVALRNAW